MDRQLYKNTVTSFGLQIVTVICGFILPKLILDEYGSEVNGLLGSINQFLQLVAFLDLGVGAVVQSSLYKPLADKDNVRISQVLVAADSFFRKIGTFLLFYITILVFTYPKLESSNFSPLYISTLIVILGSSSMFQYYYGVVDRLLLNADQRGYVNYLAQIITIVMNTLICSILIICGFSIHLVKVVTSIIYILRPVVIRRYVEKTYSIDRRIEASTEPIKQKWNGLAQHIAYIVLDSTDLVVLTAFSSLSAVSIYSIYFLVVNGVKQLLISLTGGVQSFLGRLIAKGETKALSTTFDNFVWVINNLTVLVFGCTEMLIVPFVSLYTKGVTDADYVQPVFATLLVVANAFHCLRLPFNIAILAAGHYRETQNNYIVAALMNIIASIVLVKKYGLVGVAIGTLIAMSYQTIWMAIYNSKNIVFWPILLFVKQCLVDGLEILIGIILSYRFVTMSTNYIMWAIMAAKIVFLWGMTILLVNMAFYREKVQKMMKKVIKKIKGE